MGRMGFQVSQEGVPLSRAADYQKVLDDGWPFLDIAVEKEVVFSKADWPVSSGYWIVELLEHNLGYYPGFTYREIGTTYIDPTGSDQYGISIISTRDKIYARGLWISGDPTTPLEMRIFLRVFAVDITSDYQFTGDKPAPRPRVGARRYGAKILDIRKPDTRMSDQEMSNFSLNTNAKSLGIFKTGLQDINPWSRDTNATVTAIDTATDTLTISAAIAWSGLHGHACVYFPADFVTFPGPLTNGTIYYIIPVTSTTIKLASSYDNAKAGIAIDLTSAGSLNGTLASRDNPSNPSNIITHNVGYPPTYLFAQYDDDGPGGIYSDPLNNQPVIGALGSPPLKITVTNTTLALAGAQSAYSAKTAYLIIRDPAEVAA